MSIIAFDDLLASLVVEPLGQDRYTAPNVPMPYYRIFGGQLLAQGLVIAAASTEGKRVKSMHVTFPRTGDLGNPVEYTVTRLQDGRAFASRWVIGSQEGTTIFTASVSLHAPEEAGPDHQSPAPSVAPPEACPPTDLSMIPWETRVVGGVDLESRVVGPARLELWMRAPKLADDPTPHQALFAHSTDLTLIGTTLRPHAGLSEADSPARLQTAVTTHTLWFHRPFRMDDWLLLAQESPVAAGARGFGWGHAFSRAGALVASFAQESLLRPVVDAEAGGASSG